MFKDQNNSLKKRLEAYRENPDGDVWERISTQLPNNDIGNQLANYKELPDAQVWDSIQSTLHNRVGFDWSFATSNVLTALTLVALLILNYYSDDIRKQRLIENRNELSLSDYKVKSDTVQKLAEQNSLNRSNQFKNLNDAESTERADSLSQNKPLAINADLSSDKSDISDENTRRPLRNNKNKGSRGVDVRTNNIRANTQLKHDNVDGKKLSRYKNNESTGKSDRQSQNHNDQINHGVDKDNDSAVVSNSDSLVQLKSDNIGEKFSVGNSSTPKSFLQKNNTEQRRDSVIQSIESKTDSLSLTPNIEPVKSDSLSKKDDEAKKKLNSSLGSSFYFLVMPTFGYQELDPAKNDNVLVQSLQKVSAFSLNRLGVRIEAGWEKKISDHFAIDAGLLYYQRKQTIGYNYIDPAKNNVVSSDSVPFVYISKPNQLTKTFEYELKNIGVHLGLNYEFRVDKFRHKIGVGAELHKGLTKSDIELPPSSNFYLFGNAYYRISYQLSRHIDFILQPTFNYSFKVADQLNAPFYVKPYGLGLSFGAYVKFGKR